MRTLLIVILGMLGVACQEEVSSAPADSASRQARCLLEWKNMSLVNSSKLTVPVKEVISEWKKFEPSCRGTDVFEVELAGLYFQQGDVASAKSALAGFSATSAEYRVRADILRLAIAVDERIKSGWSATRIDQEFTASYVRLLDEYPQSCPVKGTVAEYDLYVGRLTQAADLATKAVTCDPADWKRYRLAAIANEAAGRAEPVRGYCSAAIKMNRAVTHEPLFMAACAAGYAYAGDMETAKNMLSIIDLLRPGFQTAPAYRRASDLISTSGVDAVNKREQEQRDAGS